MYGQIFMHCYYYVCIIRSKLNIIKYTDIQDTPIKYVSKWFKKEKNHILKCIMYHKIITWLKCTYTPYNVGWLSWCSWVFTFSNQILHGSNKPLPSTFNYIISIKLSLFKIFLQPNQNHNLPNIQLYCIYITW